MSIDNFLVLLNDLRTLVTNRGVGNTELLKRGTMNYDKPFFIAVDQMDDKNLFISEAKSIGMFITPNTMEKTYGKERPVVMDNHLLGHIFDESFRTITEQRHKIQKLEGNLLRIKNCVERET